MAELILSVVLACCFVYASYNSFGRCIHMLQLNSYQYAGYFRTIFRIRSYFIPYFFICVFALPVAIFVRNRYASGIIISVLFVLFGLCRKPDKRAKKKLVYTKRVKRLLVTDSILCAIACAFIIIMRGKLVSLIVPVIFYALSAFLVLLSNIINTPIEKCINLYYINDAKKILKDSNAEVIGITGSYGKTSVKFYLAELMREKYDVLNTPSSYNTPMGVVRTIREHMTAVNEVFVCEMGARHVGDIKELCDIAHPDCGIITSIGEQHLETFHTFENIKKTKLELADAVEKKGKGLIFINADSVKDAKKLPYTNIITYGTTQGCDYAITDISFNESGMTFTVSSKENGSFTYTTRLLGAHNALNIAGAIAVANMHGIPLPELYTRVKRIKPIEHRQELRPMQDGIIIDDAFNSNPTGAKAALDTLACFDGCKILITPGMVELGDREYELNREFGIQAAAVCDYVFLVGRLHTESIYEGLTGSGFDTNKISVSASFKDAMAQASSMHVQGKRVILIENDLPDNY